jgi:hypothetical protein
MLMSASEPSSASSRSMDSVVARFRFEGLAVAERERWEPDFHQTQRIKLI